MLIEIDVSTVSQCVYQAMTSGTYENGLKELSSFNIWNYETPEIAPQTDNYSPSGVAELLKANGVLYGFYGAKYKNKQEVSKNLLTAAKEIFENLAQTANSRDEEIMFKSRALSCSNFLALAYWRMGALDEARAYLEHSFDFDFPDSHFGKLHAYLVESLVNLTAGLNQEMLDRINQVKSTFDTSGDLYLQGLFYMNTAVAKQCLKDFEGALADHQKASNLFRRINHRQYYCYNLNNTAFTYRAMGEKQAALQSANKALLVAIEIGDVREIAGVYDTLAYTVLDLGFTDAALWLAQKAVSTIQKTEAYGFFVEYSKTKIQILFKLNRFNEAFTAYADTINIAQDFVSEGVCKSLTESVADLMRANVNEPYKIPVIELPPERKPSACNYIKMPSNRYETLGLKKGFIAVVCKEEVKTGDLVLVSHFETGFDYFGYADFIYDDFFGGMVWLDAKDDKEARVFSVNEVEVLKVAKFGLQDKNGKFKVISLKFE